MVTRDFSQVAEGWSSVAKVLFVPYNEDEYDRLLEIINQLLDVVGENVDHPLYSLLDVASTLAEKYEDENYPDFGEGADIDDLGDPPYEL